MITQSVIPASAKGLVSPLKNLSDQELYARCQQYGLNARLWQRKFASLLPEVEERKLYQRKGYGSIYEFAAKLAGMSQHSVDVALWVFKKIADKPELQTVAEEKGFQAVRPVAAIATQETAQFWAEKAQTMSKHTLATYVHDFRLESCPGAETQSVKINISLKLNPDLAKRLERLKTAGNIEVLLERFLD